MEIAERCIAAAVDGLRADIVWSRAAIAHAAMHHKSSVDKADLDAVETLVLSHRRHDQSSNQSQPPAGGSSNKSDGNESAGNESGESSKDPQDSRGDWGQMNPLRQTSATSSSFALPASDTVLDTLAKGSDRISARNKGQRGRGSALSREFGHRLNWFQTLAVNIGRWPLQQLKFSRRRSADPVMHLVLLDTSASTLRNNRLADAKAAILKIAEQAYLEREQLGILGFGNQQVQTLLPRKRAPKALRRLLDNIEAGGGTPLRQVIEQAIRYQRQLRISQPGLRLRNYLITDGKSSASLAGLRLDGDTVLIDIESSRIRRGRGSEFANALGARYLPLPV